MGVIVGTGVVIAGGFSGCFVGRPRFFLSGSESCGCSGGSGAVGGSGGAVGSSSSGSGATGAVDGSGCSGVSGFSNSVVGSSVTIYFHKIKLGG